MAETDSEHEPRNAIISGAVTQTERELIQVAAQRAGVTMSRFVGDCAVQGVRDLYDAVRQEEEEESDAG